MRTKYIVGEVYSGLLPVLVAIVFPDTVEHAQVAHACVDGPAGIQSAGFFRIEDGQVVAYGESTSLGLASRSEDAILIAKAIGLHQRNR